MKVLVVDDKHYVRTMLKRICRRIGLDETIEAGDGRQALERFKEERPDLVLLDINMPIMSGLHCLKEMKAHRPDARVIMITGVDQPELGPACLDQGAMGFIRKNITAKDIQRSIQALLQG